LGGALFERNTTRKGGLKVKKSIWASKGKVETGVRATPERVKILDIVSERKDGEKAGDN